MLSNAGLRLSGIQRLQRSGLCIGLDPHLDRKGPLSAEMYSRFADHPRGREVWSVFDDLGMAVRRIQRESPWSGETTEFLCGLTAYFRIIVETAWDSGIRVLKPQSAFFERLPLAGQFVLSILCRDIDRLAERSGEERFTILDAKRGDIASTQAAYYDAYFSDATQPLMPAVTGPFDFDAMTVTPWMGEDVLTPALPYLQAGKALAVVTRTSNASGAAMQDALVSPPPLDIRDERGKPLTPPAGAQYAQLIGLPKTHELVLHMTEQFALGHKLDDFGVTPLFSVMGATVRASESFRYIRPNGIALIPGFGHQDGDFANIEPLLLRDGALAGHWGILSSSRALCFAWMKQYGGNGDCRQVAGELKRAIDAFRKREKQAYADAKADYPF